ncbi:MAG TPA: PAS domain-containing protein, partial [Terriglobia bacterium]|nr:PAS domain-containing protein [Terriglobia bacterium]
MFHDSAVRAHALEIRHRGGHSTSILCDASLYRDAEGNVIGMVATARPISTYEGKPLEIKPDPRVVRHLSLFTGVASVFCLAVGLLSVLGLIFGNVVLKSMIPGDPVIRMNAAVCLILLGISFWIKRSDPERHSSFKRLFSQIVAGVVAAIGLLTLAEFLFGWNLGIDEILYHEPPSDTFIGYRPGQMAPLTALNFILLGLALLALDQPISWKWRRFWLSPYFASLAAILSVVGLLDFLLGFHRSYTRIALQTSIALLLFSLGLLVARTHRGLATLLASSAAGGVLTRRLLPAAIIIPIGIATLSWRILTGGLYSGWGVVTLMTVAMITSLAVFSVWNGYIVDRDDAERRKAETILHRREVELREAQRLAGVGNWWWEPETDRVIWSEGLSNIALRDPLSPPLTYKEHLSFYTPQSSQKLADAVKRAVQTGAPYDLDLEMVRTDGGVRTVAVRGEAERDSEGRIVMVRGTVDDLTELKQAEKALRESEANLNRAQEIAHIGSWHLDVRRNQLTWSDEVFRIFRVSRETKLTYESFVSMVYPADREVVNKAWTAALQGAPYDVEHRVLAGGGLRWVRERAEVEFDANGQALSGTGTVQDITERRHAEDKLVQSNRAHRALSSCSEALVRATDESTLLDEICRLIVEQAGYRFCWVGLAEQDDAKTVKPIAYAGFEDGYLKTVNVTWADNERGRGPTGTCIRTGQTQVVENFNTDPRLDPWRAEALRRGYASSMSIPLTVDSKVFGALTIYSGEIEAFSAENVNLLTQLANDLGYGISTLHTRAERQRAVEEIRSMNAELEQRVIRRTAQL